MGDRRHLVGCGRSREVGIGDWRHLVGCGRSRGGPEGVLGSH